MKKGLRKLNVFLLAVAMILSANSIHTLTTAAAKAPRLSSAKVTVAVGKSKKVTLKNKPSGAKVTWSTKNKKIATVKKGKITGVKKGNTKVICQIVYKKGNNRISKKLTVKVTVKDASGSPSQTAAPATSTQPSPLQTAEPAATSQPPATAQPATEDPGKQQLLYQTNLGEEHTSANGITTRDNGLMRKELSTQDLMEPMALGWNLGNQLETYNSTGKTTVRACETSAGNPVARQLTFDGLKQYGVNTVRVPVAWSNLMEDDGTYTINEDLMNRVEEVINYALNDEMYVIINIHWDGGWWGMFGDADEEVRTEAWKKYETFWTQIANRYKEYSDHLIFEGANEELSTRLNDDWRHPEKGAENPTGILTEDEFYSVAAQINQKFVDIVRQTGGNNTYRHLLIPGNGQGSCHVDGTADDRFIMPTDLDENGHTKLSVSVHIYDPETFGIARTATTSWGYRDSWGVDVTDKDGNLIQSKEADYAYMTEQLDKLKRFTEDGYAVIIGECGCAVTNKDGIPDYLRELFRQSLEKGYCPVMWDEGSYYNRKDGYFTYSDVGEVFSSLTGTTPEIPDDAALNNTGIPRVIEPENKDPKVVYTWEGEFMRHTGDETATELGLDPKNPGISITDNITEGLQVTFNEEHWHMHFNTDWSSLEQPCIRIYPKDNTVSMTSQLQLVYSEKDENTQWVYEKDYDQVDLDGNINEKTAWVGKYITLDKELLAKYPWIIITTNTYTGASYVKVEICDAAYNSDGSKFE